MLDEVLDAFARSLTRYAPRDRTGPVLADVLRNSPVFRAMSDMQRLHVWRLCYQLLDDAYQEEESDS